ncbi:MAG: ArsC family reductase [Gammaproteobacteria bacterium]|nr:ArsC family reductase [Gammaproteobacteria bacterium]
MVTVFGIRNCDTIRKARRWLDGQGVEYSFHDVRSDGLSRTQLESWVKILGWENLLNRRGTSWRKLPQAVRDNINKRAAVKLMLEQPAMIKRPVLDLGNSMHLGFSEETWTRLFQ